jgi:hypothetical protein
MSKKIGIAVATVGGVAILSLILINIFTPKEDRDVNAVAAYLYSDPEVKTWLNSPKKGYIEAYFSFPQSLAKDVVFGIDIEFWDGKDTYLYHPSGVWMAYPGITRDGVLVFISGNEENLNGEPGKGELVTIQMNVSLKPNTWYKLRCEADFSKRKFVSFSINGPDINKTVDLTQYNVVLPEWAPVTQRIIFLSVGAIKLGDEAGTNVVFADDVEAGIEVDGSYKTVFRDGFENQNQILDVPKTFTVTDWSEKVWHYERNTAVVSIVDSPVHSGSHSLLIDSSPFQE